MTPKDNISLLTASAFNSAETSPFHTEGHLFPPAEECSELTVACYRSDYSASRIAHAAEDVDAQILNLNVTSAVSDYGEILVDLRINRRNPYSVARSLERYGYRLVEIRNNGTTDTSPLAERIGELLVHLNV